VTANRSTFIDACLRRDTEFTPVWFMRQAGRFLPSYRKIKGDRGVLEVAKDPDTAPSVVATAVEELGVDAAILYADIMLPMEAIGVKLEIRENVGPVILEPVRTLEAVASFKELDPSSDMPFLGNVIHETLRRLDGRVPLIGFSGAPFTLAAYLLEGGPSRELHRTKVIMHSEPDLWEALMTKLTNNVSTYLGMQVKHGVNAVQLFDSWAGCLSAADYEKHVLKYTKKVLSSIRSVPRIHFCADSGALVEEFQKTDPDVLSVDWRVPIGEVWKRCGSGISVQGNLDPVLAQVGGNVMGQAASDVLEMAQGHSGHIFSLGHGVLQETDPANLKKLVSYVHQRTRNRR
jgi:uroporphyrinogen decarboxylase